MIGELLPPGVAGADTMADIGEARLFPAEAAAMAGAGPRRRAEFAAGRWCARQALAGLGMPPAPVTRGPAGEPQWPDGVTGSITHCRGYRAAAVGRCRDVAAIGIDAEPDAPLPAGVLGLIGAGAGEAWARQRQAGVSADRLLFCAKESAFKAWFGLTGQPLRPADAVVGCDLDGGTFAVSVPAAGPDGAGRPARLDGRWLARGGLIVAAIVVPA